MKRSVRSFTGALDRDAAGSLGALVSASNADVSAIYVAKYNRFVDTILGRINKILKDKYDPVTVKLTNPTVSSKSKNKKTKTSSKNKSKKSKRRKSNKSRARASRDLVISAEPNDSISGTAAEIIQQLTEEPKVVATTLTSVPNGSGAPMTTPSDLSTRIVSNEVAATSSTRGTSGNTGKRKKTKTRTSNKTGNKTRKPSGSSNKVKQQPSKPSKKSRSKARATLYGLASLKRAGDVSVNMMSDHTTIRTRFNLGPLVLKVEKEFARSTRKEVRSATATTAEMSGRLSLRVYHGGAATLHSIRVLQPKQMRIESADDHDQTREFVWKRSSHIAHLVSQKLSSATRSMLRPPPSTAAAA